MHNFVASIIGRLENTDSLSYAKFPNVQWKSSRYVYERYKIEKAHNRLARQQK